MLKLLCRLCDVSLSLQIPPVHHEALVDSEEWLVNDTGPPSKRRCGTRGTGSYAIHGNSSTVDSGTRLAVVDESSDNFDNGHVGSHDDGAIDVSSYSPLCYTDVCNHGDHDDDMIDNGPPHIYGGDAASRSGTVVKVCIENESYLVPYGSCATVQWLAVEVSDRYFLRHGRQPVVHISKEGSLLSLSDAVRDILRDGDSVHAHIDHWNTTPINQHYTNTCNKFNKSKHYFVMLPW